MNAVEQEITSAVGSSSRIDWKAVAAKTTAIFSVILLIILIGCMQFQKELTPARIEDDQREYIASAGVLDNPIESLKVNPIYDTMAELERTAKYIDHAHHTTQLRLAQESEVDAAVYTFLAQQSARSLKEAEAVREFYFGETGIVAGLIGLTGISVGWLGLRRPSDVPKRDAELREEQAGREDPTVFAYRKSGVPITTGAAIVPGAGV